MRIRFALSFAVLLTASTAGLANTRYVSTNGLNQTPFTNWTMAATNILTAYNAIGSGDTILLSNGIHRVTAQINLNNNVTITGAYGAAQTIIDGGGGVYSVFAGGGVRTVNLYDLTITNSGGAGAINVAQGTYYLNHCVIAGNLSTIQGCLYVNAGGILYVTNCVIKGNAGPGLYLVNTVTAVLDNCEISTNGGRGADAGSAAAGSSLILRNCRISGNWNTGVYYPSLIDNCLIVNNQNGGAVIGAGSTIQNCLVAYNYCPSGPGGVTVNGGMRNCTVVSNYAGWGYGGIRVTAGITGLVVNSIVYFNKAGTQPSFTNYNATDGLVWTNCLTGPLPANGTGCTNANPSFVSFATGNFRLNSNSPCIDKGFYQSWMDTAVDLDTNRRIIGAAVDIGAYEFKPPPPRGSLFFVR